MKISEDSEGYILLNDKIYVKKEKIMMFSYNAWVNKFESEFSTYNLIIKIIMTLENGNHYDIEKIIYNKDEYNYDDIDNLAKKVLKNFIKKFNDAMNPSIEKVHI
jgi:hypothetical protein